MEDFVRLFSTDEGDVYHITLSEDTTLLSDEVKEYIRGTKLVGIDLRRLVDWRNLLFPFDLQRHPFKVCLDYQPGH